MTVNQLIRKLQAECKAGNGKLQVKQFGHDHDPEKHDEGTGYTRSVLTFTNDAGETFVGLCT